jgi:hypothetical protein
MAGRLSIDDSINLAHKPRQIEEGALQVAVTTDAFIGLPVIYPCLRKFASGFLRFLGMGKGLIDSKGFKHIFTLFTVRHKNVWLPTGGIANTTSGDFDMMVFVLHYL